ncbi:Single-stranded nucleic acid binding R3H [Cinnamomum micranthum f. kanehirae]|uniref:Single-stranded nucleic acid binding R3H n=1 Tax=Cinnamomum micranthum f. kanehirae TaxID=337451 RepID=A0A443P8S4_9MAGN|nr:Single-stranded nucleic acid binding R3H [Cinnamomum micranthum f. kanehirae]
MTTAQFVMVEELASLIKDNLSCKHLVLSIEEALINFLQNDTSPDGVLELEPMSPYHRLLLHRLADIYGFAHESVGEGNDRHLILERCPESSIPSVLVSDILWQYDHDEFQSPMTSHQLLKKEDTLPGTKMMKQTSFPHPMSLEEREAAYLAARERIFALGEDEVKLPVTPKQRNIPVVARRMIAHALGQKISSSSSDDKHCHPNNKEANVALGVTEDKDQLSSALKSSENPISLSSQNSSAHGRKTCNKGMSRGSVNCGLNSEKGMQSQAVCHGSSSSDVLETGCDGRVGDKDNLEREHLGAAKRMFAQALGLPSTKQNHGLTLKCSEASKSTTKNIKG